MRPSLCTKDIMAALQVSGAFIIKVRNLIKDGKSLEIPKRSGRPRSQCTPAVIAEIAAKIAENRMERRPLQSSSPPMTGKRRVV